MAKSAKGPVDIFAGIKNVKFEGQPPEQTERIKPDINSDKPIEETIKRSEKNETDISQNTEKQAKSCNKLLHICLFFNIFFSHLSL